MMWRSVQLTQVDAALEAEPENEELKGLRAELANLVALTKSLNAEKEQESDAKARQITLEPNTVPKQTFRAGDDVMARHAADGKWYPGKVASVAGQADSPLYSIIYTKTRTTEMLTADSLRVRKMDPNAAPPASAKSSAKANAQRMMSNDEREKERERKRVKKEKKIQREAEKDRVHDEKKSAWQKFAAKGAKKGYFGGSKNMFKTPEDPHAKIGIVGAGRGMTPSAQRSKHVYEEES
ncbi:hypothetical protein MVES_000769 [Malassezia vespertilionis]|uniref:Tudor domain-containing protein n=1 Tax=Malassezia vespertilionis TaxID=2020962 RepID=A0A2N1JF31_9BASI|nr:hypothetical protein MVES_000769 [Malassezia vespertilionis]